MPDNKTVLKTDTWPWNLKVHTIWGEPCDKKIPGLKKYPWRRGLPQLESGLVLLRRCSGKVNRKVEHWLLFPVVLHWSHCHNIARWHVKLFIECLYCTFSYHSLKRVSKPAQYSDSDFLFLQFHSHYWIHSVVLNLNKQISQ